MDDIIFSSYYTFFLKLPILQHGHKFVKMNYYIDYFHCWTGNQIISKGIFGTKFIFIIVRPSEINDFDIGLINNMDKDFDQSQLPQIINVELQE